MYLLQDLQSCDNIALRLKDIPNNKNVYFVCIINVLYYCVFCIFWTLYVRQCHIFENVLLYVVTDGPFGLVFINKLET